MSDKTLIVIVGPTAIGKTDLAIKVARQYQTEIVSADSRQFYREMEIGTAKPSAEELSTVRHHFINSHSISEEFSVGDFETSALAVLDEIFKTHRFAVLVGGSGLFIKAVTEGFDNLPKADPGIREELNLLFQKSGIEPLREKLKIFDPAYYAEVDLSNPQRIIRALEVSISTGKSFSSFRFKQQKERPFNILKIGLNINREDLYYRINNRVDKMVDAGLVEEVGKLQPYRHLNALNTVGYSELFDAFDGRISINQAIENVKQNTRRFAKRQLTWFKKDEEIKWFSPLEWKKILYYINSMESNH